MDKMKFPRELSSIEKFCLLSILPAAKPGYNFYRRLIDNYMVIGSGRFEGNNFDLGKKNDKPDLTIASSPVFAIGSVKINDEIIDVIIHENEEDKIEFDLSGDLENILNINEEIKNVKTLSKWNPGEKEPYNNTVVREYNIKDDKYILCIAQGIKKIWHHKKDSGVNHIIPLTNFFNELMRIKNVRNANTPLNPSYFFPNLDEFSEQEIINAFIMYNKYMNKFKLPFRKMNVEKQKKKRKISKFFSKEKT